MEKFIIHGGEPLAGEVTIGGAKNHALKLFAASVLFEDPITIQNVPLIEDIFRMKELLEGLGAKITKTGQNTFCIDSSGISRTDLDREITKRFRASVVLVGPLLARFGRVSLPHPGGCVFGERPIDLFVAGFEQMGARFKEKDGCYVFESGTLRGADFTFRIPSVTATETLMLSAVLAQGKTTLRNAACEPEIEALAHYLNSAGAKIQEAGTQTIVIEGLGKHARLKSNKPSHVIPDRIEAGSFLILGSLLATDLRIKKCRPEHLASLIAHLEAAGVNVEVGPDWIRVCRPEKLTALDLKTREYPGFPTDLQAPFSIFLTQAKGKSQVFETVFDGRLEYMIDLKRMGAEITICDPHRAIIFGPTPLHGREIESPDIRAGLAFVIAALVAKGRSTVHNVYQIDRGYERIEKKLKQINANIKRVE